MTLEDVGKKYNISDAFLNSKEDGLVIAYRSINEIIHELKNKNGDSDVIAKLQYLADFLTDVKTSGY